MSTSEFKAARDLLLALRDNYEFARSGFQWPRLKRFNWALDWFDAELSQGRQWPKTSAENPWRYEIETFEHSASLSQASSRAANGLAVRSAPSAAIGSC